MATEPDFFVKQGDFQFLAQGRSTLYYRDTAKALADWERGWRDLFLRQFPDQVAAIDAALGFDPDALDDEGDEDEGDEDEDDGATAEGGAGDGGPAA